MHCCVEGEGGDGEWYVVHDGNDVEWYIVHDTEVHISFTDLEKRKITLDVRLEFWRRQKQDWTSRSFGSHA